MNGGDGIKFGGQPKPQQAGLSIVDEVILILLSPLKSFYNMSYA
ncbi:hypothetical protein [Paenibacillus oralis]|nr:hypothetical protein [Paenibacillus oralis]